MDTVTICGVTYITDNALLHGDYCGAGAVARANIKAIEEIAASEGLDTESYSMTEWNDYVTASKASPEDPRSHWAWPTRRVGGALEWPESRVSEEPPTAHSIKLWGAYSSEQLWVREDCEALASVVKALSDYPLVDEEALYYQETEEEDEAWDSWVRDDVLRALPEGLRDYVDYTETEYSVFRDAAEECNEYWQHEQNGPWFNIERVMPTIIKRIREDAVSAMDNVEFFEVTAPDEVCHEPGWYWRVCMPGCLPDTEAFGPFEDSGDATDDAIRSWVEGRG